MGGGVLIGVGERAEREESGNVDLRKRRDFERCVE